MPFYSPFNFPFFYNRYPNNKNVNSYNGYPNYNHTNFYGRDSENTHNNNNKFSSTTYDVTSSNTSKNFSSNAKKQKEDSENFKSSESFFELFGLKLYFDDILIICILFFLYTENVQDEELFICLILLLLS